MTMAQGWQCRFLESIAQLEAVLFYAADPGAFCVLESMEGVAQSEDVEVIWHLEGWAKDNVQKEKNISFDDLSRIDALYLGQEVNYARVGQILQQYHGKRCIFISDHWKDISDSFFALKQPAPILPNEIWVPDEVGAAVQRAGLIAHAVEPSVANDIVKVFGQPAVDAQVKAVQQYSKIDIQNWRAQHDLREQSCILFALDPLERSDSQDCGFDWRDALLAGVDYFQESRAADILLVKPHPRQKRQDVDALIRPYPFAKIIDGDVAPWIALSSQVWGITSIVLIVAKHSEKKIISFQTGRNEFGKSQSNAHIEPFVRY